MIGRVHYFTHPRHIRGDTRSGLVVGYQHRLDLVLLVGFEALAKGFYRHALAGVAVDPIHVELMTLTKVYPQMGEIANVRGEHLVTWR
jgi:hypothetical protein